MLSLWLHTTALFETAAYTWFVGKSRVRGTASNTAEASLQCLPATMHKMVVCTITTASHAAVVGLYCLHTGDHREREQHLHHTKYALCCRHSEVFCAKGPQHEHMLRAKEPSMEVNTIAFLQSAGHTAHRIACSFESKPLLRHIGRSEVGDYPHRRYNAARPVVATHR
jgi:hypothetical protein